ncbi:MAG: CinA family protein [Ruminococcaceae bacterium]|nr:CinA family protein [Oscillospiraceae bacterium]
MIPTANDVIRSLAGKTLATAESLTGGMIGSLLTAVPGASAVYKGGVICYTNEIKANVLGVPAELLETWGAVSAPVAKQMALGVRKLMHADLSVAVTGLAGPGGDEFGHPVGTVFVAVAHADGAEVREWHFDGDRAEVRAQTCRRALEMVLEYV